VTFSDVTTSVSSVGAFVVSLLSFFVVLGAALLDVTSIGVSDINVVETNPLCPLYSTSYHPSPFSITFNFAL